MNTRHLPVGFVSALAVLALSACPTSEHGAPCDTDADCGLEYLCKSGYCLSPDLEPDPALLPDDDAGTRVDAGRDPVDAGAGNDAGAPVDGGAPVDSGMSTDAGQTDGGQTSDGGAPTDGGAPVDGGTPTDAGQTDAGQTSDGGAQDDGGGSADAGPVVDAGPGCNEVPPATRSFTRLQPDVAAIDVEDFGQEMDAYESRLVVSDPETANVFIYAESGGAYGQPPSVVSGSPSDSFGWAVTTAADVVVVTAPTGDAVNDGGVLVHRESTLGNGDWQLSEELVCMGADSNTFMGARAVMREVATNKYVLLVGAFGYPQSTYDDAGAVCVWTYNALTHTFTARSPVLRADPSVPGSFGAPLAVSDDGSYLAVRSSTQIVDSFATGEVFLYGWSNQTDSYSLLQTLTPAPYTLPSGGLYDEYYEGWFGQALDFAGDTLFVGASGWLPAAQSNHGAVYEFTRSSGTGQWSETALIPSPGPTYFGFGGAVAADGDLVVVGTGPWFSYDTDRATFVYRRGCSGWFLEESLAKDARGSFYDRFSDRVELTANHIVVGNHNEIDYSVTATGYAVGAVRVYPRSTN